MVITSFRSYKVLNLIGREMWKVLKVRKVRKAEKDLLQARIKTINFTLDNTSKQLEECRSQLAAIISTQSLRECQDFVDKVGEIRFNKVKQRQLNKFNLLTIRKEGNITRSNTNLNNHNHNLNSQTNSQVNQISQAREGSTPPQASPPSGEDNRSSQAGPPHGEASTSPPPSQANSQAREGGAPPQVGNIPPREDSSLSQATTSSLPQASAPQAGAIPPGEDNIFPRLLPPPSLRPVLSCPHRKAADLPTLPVPKQV